MGKTLHGPSSQVEFTLCGMAFDAFESGDADEPIIEAKGGQRITCDECRRVLDLQRHMYGTRGYTLKRNWQDEP